MKESTIDLIALSKGNTQAFDCLFLLYYPKVRTFIYSILDNEEEAEDLAQDTFIKLWTARAQLSHVQNINAYIYQTAKHVLYTFLDKKIKEFSLNEEYFNMIKKSMISPHSRNRQCARDPLS